MPRFGRIYQHNLGGHIDDTGRFHAKRVLEVSNGPIRAPVKDSVYAVMVIPEEAKPALQFVHVVPL